MGEWAESVLFKLIPRVTDVSGKASKLVAQMFQSVCVWVGVHMFSFLHVCIRMYMNVRTSIALFYLVETGNLKLIS